MATFRHILATFVGVPSASADSAETRASVDSYLALSVFDLVLDDGAEAADLPAESVRVRRRADRAARHLHPLRRAWQHTDTHTDPGYMNRETSKV